MHQHRVDFDGDHFFRPGEKEFRQCAFTGADFNDQRSGFSASGIGNRFQDGFAGEKVLPQTTAQG